MIGTQALCARSMDPLEPERFVPITGVDCLNKPRGRGLWTSTWLGPERISDWAGWCHGEEFAGGAGPHRVWLLEPDRRAGVVDIDSTADLDAFCARFRAPAQWGYEGNGLFPYVDFDRIVAEGIVGVHLTEAGQWATRFRSGASALPSLYGWDCESTLWLRWEFAAVTLAGMLTRTAPDPSLVDS